MSDVSETTERSPEIIGTARGARGRGAAGTTLGPGYLGSANALPVSTAQQVDIPPSPMRLGDWFGFEAWSEIIWPPGVVLIFHVLLTRTRWGLYTGSVGGNLLGAREAGISV